MNKHILRNLIPLVISTAIAMGGILLLTQDCHARDKNSVSPGRLLGSGQYSLDGCDSALDGPPGSLSTGRYTSNAQNDNTKTDSNFTDSGFSLNLIHPQTHGHTEDVGARAGWSWKF
jgi:hypothetical protein